MTNPTDTARDGEKRIAAWGVFTKHGGLLLWSVRGTRRDAERSVQDNFKESFFLAAKRLGLFSDKLTITHHHGRRK